MTISIRHSPGEERNPGLKKEDAKDRETNRQWLKRVRGEKDARGALILLGGSSLAHFRIRYAQSRLRRDLLPSFWSLVGILKDDETFDSVPLGLVGDISWVAEMNGVQTCELDDYDDPKWFPNIAVIDFTKTPEPVLSQIERVASQRSVVDLPSLMLPWLGYVWGTALGENPLAAGHGLPSAAFVETVYGLAGIELTPGLSSSASCPEAIWQTARWWQDFYEVLAEAEERKTHVDAKAGDEAKAEDQPSKEEATQGTHKRARAMIPSGVYATRQPAAAVEEEEE